jgi:hypothetical protein
MTLLLNYKLPGGKIFEFMVILTFFYIQPPIGALVWIEWLVFYIDEYGLNG